MENPERLEDYRSKWMRDVDVHLMVTERCNYSCRHCLVGNKNGTLNSQLAYDVIDDLCDMGNNRIMFNGGEVFTYPGFLEIARHAHSRGFHASCVSNGSLITAEVAEVIKETDLEVALSIDGPPEIHNFIRNNNCAFENVERALANLNRSSVPFFGAVFSVMKDNLQYVDWVVDYCIRRHITFLRIQPILKKGNAALPQFEDKLLSPDELLLLYDKIQSLSCERVFEIDIITIGAFLEDIREHRCKFGLCFGDCCHHGSIPWPKEIGVSVDGSIFPFEPVFGLDHRWIIGNATEGLKRCLGRYYGSSSHTRLLDLVEDFVETIAPEPPLPVNLDDLTSYIQRRG